jgi:hypothetical protein
MIRSGLVFNKPQFIACYSRPTATFFLTTMASIQKSERDDKPFPLEENPRSTATELDKVRNFESEKRNKLITAQDELDETQDLFAVVEEQDQANKVESNYCASPVTPVTINGNIATALVDSGAQGKPVVHRFGMGKTAEIDSNSGDINRNGLLIREVRKVVRIRRN